MDIRDQRRIGQEPKPKGPVPIEPTPEEIAERCLEIQATWSEDERIRRRGLSKVAGERWDVPCVREGEQ